MNEWMQVAIAVGVGLLLGLVASRVVLSVLGGPSRPEPLQRAARPLAGLAFSIGVIGGLITALGIIQPSALDQLGQDALAFIPKLLTAAIIVIAANTLSAFATAALSGALARLPLSTQRQALTAVKVFIVSLATLLAVSQLGINTDVVNLGVAAVFFGAAASLTLLIGLGGRHVAQEVASTRAIRRLVKPGDTIEIGDVRGVVTALHPTAVEVADGHEETVLIPSSLLVEETFSIRRTPAAAPES